MAAKRKKKTAARTGTRTKKKTRAMPRTRTKSKARPKAKARTKAKRTAVSRRASAAGKRRTSPKTKKVARVTAQNVTPEEAEFIQEHADALSRTTKSAKWVHSADEHEDRAGQSLATRSHEVIQRWAEARGAKPATIEGTEHGDRAGVLRFNFPGYAGGGQLKEIDWDRWFKTFDDRGLVFLFQEHKRDGKQSNFFQLDSPERERG
ncbi:hypothetical protein SVA_1971 [Sulfurifustis variabilis]|uniref:1,4-alpha-glucan branching enzyme n=1 Tax=Sulfurifustis variabilis TaxID=1675686 RepID=A0A1B4VA99_9GAMM|nr:hypothetical protein SVA_1971 [Sulfurifustis variabilis]